MSNIEEAKKSLERTSAIENIINPPPKVKRPKSAIKLPLVRDMNMIQSIIKEKLKEKEETIEENVLSEAKVDWDNEINAIHRKAVDLRKEAETLAKAIEIKTKGAITINIESYGHYWHDLPETMNDAQDSNLLEINKDKISSVSTIRKEIEDYLLDIKLGLKPIADVRILIEKIDNIK